MALSQAREIKVSLILAAWDEERGGKAGISLTYNFESFHNVEDPTIMFLGFDICT